MPAAKELQLHVKAERVPVSVLDACEARSEACPTPLRDALKALIARDGAGRVRDEFHAVIGFVDDVSTEFALCSVLSLDVEDFDAAEARILALVAGTEHEGSFDFFRGGAHRKGPGADHIRSIEIYYDLKDIPPGYPNAFDFRNEAMDLIETALLEADAGEWAGAESGKGEVNFGFEVTDFDHAEKVVRAAVAGTPYAGIREITRTATAA